jgi:hypothetical protein
MRPRKVNDRCWHVFDLVRGNVEAWLRPLWSG